VCPHRYNVVLLQGKLLCDTQSILKHGIEESTSGNLGKAVYFLLHEDRAAEIAKHLVNGSPETVVVECQVNLGKCKIYSGTDHSPQTPADPTGRWRDGYDSAMQPHAAWKSAKGFPVTEIAVKKENVKVLKIYTLDGKEIKKGGPWTLM